MFEFGAKLTLHDGMSGVMKRTLNCRGSLESNFPALV